MEDWGWGGGVTVLFILMLLLLLSRKEGVLGTTASIQFQDEEVSSEVRQ